MPNIEEKNCYGLYVANDMGHNKTKTCPSYTRTWACHGLVVANAIGHNKTHNSCVIFMNSSNF